MSDCRHWAVNGTPHDFGVELLPSDLERIADPLGVVMERHFGLRALTSLHIEKGHGSWGREYTQDFTAVEAGQQHLVRADKPTFIGREALLAQLVAGPSRSLRMLAIESSGADPIGGEPIMQAGRSMARLTSAAFGHTVGYSVGLAYLPVEIDAQAEGLEVEFLDSRWGACGAAVRSHG